MPQAALAPVGWSRTFREHAESSCRRRCSYPAAGAQWQSSRPAPGLEQHRYASDKMTTRWLPGSLSAGARRAGGGLHRVQARTTCRFTEAVSPPWCGSAPPRSRSTDTVATVDWRQHRVRALIAELPTSASAGAHGLRLHDWTRNELLAGFDPPWALLLTCRSILASLGEEPWLYYVCAGPVGTTLEQLVAVAGSRWAIEECLAAAKGEAGLASYQVRGHKPPGIGTSPLTMLAHAYLSATRATAEKGTAAGTEQPIALTMPELRRLLNGLIRPPRPDLDHIADWSWSRRRRQAQARATRHRARGQAPP